MNDDHTFPQPNEILLFHKNPFKMNCKLFFLIDASIPLPFVLLRSGYGFTPTERGDSDLLELSNTNGKTAFRQGDSAHGAALCWQCLGGVFNSIAL